jgi:hypothetical protein
MSKTRILPLLALVAFVSGSTNAASEQEQSFIDLFGGTWEGSATLIKGSVPWQVNCRASGQPMANRIAIEGNCNIAIISVRIGADITYDPSTGHYSGTYVGAKVGPARVEGKRDGSIVNLAITWPKPVHGDIEARMTIENAGGGSLRMTIFDNVAPGGPEQKTLDASLTLN